MYVKTWKTKSTMQIVWAILCLSPQKKDINKQQQLFIIKIISLYL